MQREPAESGGWKVWSLMAPVYDDLVWHCVQSVSPLRPWLMLTFSEKSLGEPCARWQLVQAMAPALKQPLSDNACGRLNRFGRPSGQNSPCRSLSGIGSLSRNGIA